MKKTICFWCGKSHKKEKPAKCEEASKKMSSICKKIPVWQVMRVLEIYGITALDTYDALYQIGKTKRRAAK